MEIAIFMANLFIMTQPIIIESPKPGKLLKIDFNAPIMNPEENTDRQEREERYRVSQDDTSIIRKEVNLLTSAVGDMKMEVMKVAEALQGNKFGNRGLIERLEYVEKMAKSLEDKIEDVIAKAKSRETYVRIIWGLICGLVSMAATVVIERLTGKGK